MMRTNLLFMVCLNLAQGLHVQVMNYGAKELDKYEMYKKMYEKKLVDDFETWRPTSNEAESNEHAQGMEKKSTGRTGLMKGGSPSRNMHDNFLTEESEKLGLTGTDKPEDILRHAPCSDPSSCQRDQFRSTTRQNIEKTNAKSKSGLFEITESKLSEPETGEPDDATPAPSPLEECNPYCFMPKEALEDGDPVDPSTCPAHCYDHLDGSPEFHKLNHTATPESPEFHKLNHTTKGQSCSDGQYANWYGYNYCASWRDHYCGWHDWVRDQCKHTCGNRPECENKFMEDDLCVKCGPWTRGPTPSPTPSPPGGHQLDLSLDSLGAGWEVFYDMPYYDHTQLVDIFPPEGECLLWGAKGSSTSSTLSLAGIGLRETIVEAIKSNATSKDRVEYGVMENNLYWYSKWGQSNGFALSDNVQLNSADVGSSDCEARLSWHMGQPYGGYRSGCTKSLNGNPTWRKIVMYGPCVDGKGSSLLVYRDDPAGVGGDPHATNLAGHKFEILQVGTFPLVEIRAARFASFSPYLAVSAGINHVERDCGPTYIQNVSLSGQWLSELAGTSGVQVRVVHWVPKAEALEVRINDQEHEWHPVSRAKEALNIVSKATDSQVNFQLHKVTVHVSLGQNERKVDKARGYNFLNVNFRGLDAKNKDMKLSGLIISDDLSAVSKAPEKCQAAHFSKGAGQADTTFLSYITLGQPIDQVHDADQAA